MSGDINPPTFMSRVVSNIINSQPISCAIVSSDLRLVDASNTFVKLFAIEEDIVKGCLLTDLLYEFVASEEKLKEILAGQINLYRIENVCRFVNNGERRYFNFTVQPLAAEKPSDGLLLMTEDVSLAAHLQQQLVQERNELRLVRQKLDKANKELIQLNEMKSLFLSMAAHDLRAPLTSVFGYADLLLEMSNISKELQKQGLITIRREAERMHRLIDDLLSLDQIERRHVSIIPKTFALNEGVEEAIRSLEPFLLNDELTLDLKLPKPSINLWVDPNKMMQILYNLLQNAIKYTPSGGKITILAYLKEPNAVLEVQNSGANLTEEQLVKLFKLYYRTELAKHSNRSGTGLGLFIVKMLVEAHKGKIDVRSETGLGTTFIVHLPLA